MSIVDKVIQIATNEIGYLEKKSKLNLYNKTSNAGDDNYTKYWEDLSPGMNGNPWCNCFINWCFVKAYGRELAKKLLCTDNDWSYYTPTSASYFKNKNQWYTSNPKVGDIIFYKNDIRICHVGIVYKVDLKYVYTIEGNTSKASGVISNGGGVAKKQYSLGYNRIAGYGRPNYSILSLYTYDKFIKDVMNITKSSDKIELLGKTVTISKTINNKHRLVLPIQKYLNSLGYNCGNEDGIFGIKTENAVNEYQNKVLKYKHSDGEITAKMNMWKHLLKL